MDPRLCFILLYVFGVLTVESHRHHHGPHHNHTRRVPNHLADLKNRILHGYDSTINPDNKVVVQMGWTLFDVRLCAHKQVRNYLCIYHSWHVIIYIINSSLTFQSE